MDLFSRRGTKQGGRCTYPNLDARSELFQIYTVLFTTKTLSLSMYLSIEQNEWNTCMIRQATIIEKHYRLIIITTINPLCLDCSFNFLIINFLLAFVFSFSMFCVLSPNSSTGLFFLFPDSDIVILYFTHMTTTISFLLAFPRPCCSFPVWQRQPTRKTDSVSSSMALITR